MLLLAQLYGTLTTWACAFGVLFWRRVCECECLSWNHDTLLLVTGTKIRSGAETVFGIRIKKNMRDLRVFICW